MHEFDAGDRNDACRNRLNPSIGPKRSLMDRWSCSIRLLRYFDDVSLGPLAAAMRGEELPGRSVRSLIAVERNGARQGALALERPAEESFRGSDIPLCAQQEIDGLSIAVDGAIKIGPAAFDLHVRFIDAP